MNKAAISFGFLGILLVLPAQNPPLARPQPRPSGTPAQGNIRIELTKPGAIALAVIDLRGSGPAQPVMAAFNATLYDDLRNSGLFKLVPKGVLPLNSPQQPSDFKGITNPAAARAVGAIIFPTGQVRRHRPTILRLGIRPRRRTTSWFCTGTSLTSPSPPCRAGR